MNPNPPTPPAILAIELLALNDPKSKDGLSLRVLIDGSAARMMIAGSTGARVGSMNYSNGEIAHWMACHLSAAYQGPGGDAAWSDAEMVDDRLGFGAAFAIRAAHASEEATVSAMREAAAKISARFGSMSLVEFGYCDRKGKGPALSDWTELHADKVSRRLASNEDLTRAFLIFTDQRSALKPKAEAAPSSNPAAIIAAAVAMELDD
jgi:hypothetical protein